MNMKQKQRVVVTFIIGITLFVSVLLFLELSDNEAQSEEDSRRPREGPHRGGLGFLQGKVEDVLGIRKIVKGTDISLKSENEVQDKLKDVRDNGNGDGNLNAKQKSVKTTIYDVAVESLLSKLDKDKNNAFDKDGIAMLDFKEMAQTLGGNARQMASHLKWYQWKKKKPHAPNWEKFHFGIQRFSMYDPTNQAIDGLLHDMATQKFKSIEMMTKGTELKLLVTFPDYGVAVLKPMRWGRDHETLPNHYYFNDYERHNSEIASFHLDRVLGFYRVPPVTGRLVNMTTELFMLAEKKLKKTFYVSPVGNLCFYGECTYYCDSRHSFCGNVDMIEVSLMTFLPDDELKGHRKRWKSPYRRSYSKFRKADWETDGQYCDDIKKTPPYKSGRILLDIIDMHIFDFLTGNMDRHHVELFEEFGNYSNLIHLDNGRGFGKANFDEFSILAPLRQCCLVRESTFIKFSKLYIGPERLSDLLDSSMKSDPVYPILTQGHLNALDRRVVHVLRTIARCVEHNGDVNNVIIKDKF